jgi:hypothetical protein
MDIQGDHLMGIEGSNRRITGLSTERPRNLHAVLRKMPGNPLSYGPMSTDPKRELLQHPEHGRLPARKLLDCIFALAPDGGIQHYHIEQMTVAENGGAVLYTLTDKPPADERKRCQIIPPFVTEFGTVA